jgi:hypothetical protein
MAFQQSVSASEHYRRTWNTAHELVRGNGHDSGLVAACIVPPMKRDVAATEGNETGWLEMATR